MQKGLSFRNRMAYVDAVNRNLIRWTQSLAQDKYTRNTITRNVQNKYIFYNEDLQLLISVQNILESSNHIISAYFRGTSLLLLLFFVIL